MLCVLVAVDRDRYVIDVADLVEVLPLVAMKTVPHAPPGVAGTFNFRGRPTPAVDLGVMLGGPPARAWFSTRILVVAGASGAPADRLGLIVERATATMRCEASAFQPSGIQSPRAPYLGCVVARDGALIQRIHPAALLTPEIRAVLGGAEGSS